MRLASDAFEQRVCTARAQREHIFVLSCYCLKQNCRKACQPPDLGLSSCYGLEWFCRIEMTFCLGQITTRRHFPGCIFNFLDAAGMESM
eukprot:2955675-Pleurochrysis_carterae.AAC.1